MGRDTPQRPIVFGEVLFDHFPDGSVVLGGAPFNVAWHLQAFGQAPLFVSRVGDDALGRQIRDAMSGWGMDPMGLQEDPLHPTGTVEVQITDGEPHYDIVENRAYDFIAPAELPPVQDAAILYHGTLALRYDTSLAALGALTGQTPAPRFVDVNLRAPWWQRQRVLDLIDGAATVKLNEDELARLGDGDGDLLQRAETLRRTCRIGALVLTRGAAGAHLLTDAGVSGINPAARTDIVDTVGAGDAFASVMLLGQLEGWSDGVSLQRAQAFASALVGVRGATVSDSAFYAEFKAEWID